MGRVLDMTMLALNTLKFRAGEVPAGVPLAKMRSVGNGRSVSASPAEYKGSLQHDMLWRCCDVAGKMCRECNVGSFGSTGATGVTGPAGVTGATGAIGPPVFRQCQQVRQAHKVL